MLKIILLLLDKEYKDMARITVFSDGSGHITDESFLPLSGDGKVVFVFDNFGKLLPHLLNRAWVRYLHEKICS